MTKETNFLILSSESKSEIEVSEAIKNLANKNISTEELTCFLGAGAYDHYVPSIIKHITSRSEFYTAYTPYQAEISQGTLQAIFEFQSMIAEITKMDIANASMYDGATAAVEGCILAASKTRRKKVVVSRTVHPETRKILKTYLQFKDCQVVEVDYDRENGTTDLNKLQEKGYKASIYFEDDSLKKKMSYANKLDVSNVILIGEEEVERNEIKIKNMSRGETRSIKYELV